MLATYLPTFERLHPRAPVDLESWALWTEAAAPAAGPLSRAEAERAARSSWTEMTTAEARCRGYAITRLGWAIDLVEYAYDDGHRLFRVFCGPSLVLRTEDEHEACATWAALVRSYGARVGTWPLAS